MSRFFLAVPLEMGVTCNARLSFETGSYNEVFLSSETLERNHSGDAIMSGTRFWFYNIEGKLFIRIKIGPFDAKPFETDLDKRYKDFFFVDNFTTDDEHEVAVRLLARAYACGFESFVDNVKAIALLGIEQREIIFNLWPEWNGSLEELRDCAANLVH